MWLWTFQLGGLLLCLRVITVNPALVTLDKKVASPDEIWWSSLQTLTCFKLLISCQNPGHKFGGDTMHAQFSSQNPLACPITNSDLIIKVLNGSTSIPMNELLKFGNGVGRCTANGPTCAFVVLSGCLTDPELSTPFKHPCMAHVFFPECLSDHCQVSRDLHKIWCTLTVPFSDPLPNGIMPDTWLQIKGCRKSARPLSCVKFCTLLVLSSTVALHYYIYCTDGSTRPRNCGYHLLHCGDLETPI
jgi:hypothetical protein